MGSGIGPMLPRCVRFKSINGRWLDHAEEAVFGRLLWCRDGLYTLFKIFGQDTEIARIWAWCHRRKDADDLLCFF
eukprot:scaffold145585_cov129-Cyclotella_meneghiniana.AAC.1